MSWIYSLFVILLLYSTTFANNFHEFFLSESEIPSLAFKTLQSSNRIGVVIFETYVSKVSLISPTYPELLTTSKFKIGDSVLFVSENLNIDSEETIDVYFTCTTIPCSIHGYIYELTDLPAYSMTSPIRLVSDSYYFVSGSTRVPTVISNLSDGEITYSDPLSSLDGRVPPLASVTLPQNSRLVCLVPQQANVLYFTVNRHFGIEYTVMTVVIPVCCVLVVAGVVAGVVLRRKQLERKTRIRENDCIEIV